MTGTLDADGSPNSGDREFALRERELYIQEQELALKTRELDLKAKDQQYARWFNPVFLGLLAATVTLMGNFFIIKRQSAAALDQERVKAQSSLILEAIKTGDADRAVKNLEFFLQLGFIDDPNGRISSYLAQSQNVPVLPSMVERSPELKFSPEEREIAYRISKLIVAIEKLADRSNPDKLAAGASADDLRAVLRDFASKPGFEALYAAYSGKTTLALVAELRKHMTDAKIASQLDEVLAHLSHIDGWIDMRVRPNVAPDPKVLAGEVIRSFIIPRWRAMDLYFIDCPPDSPFC